MVEYEKFHELQIKYVGTFRCFRSKFKNYIQISCLNLETKYSHKLMVEYEKFHELQIKYQKMQEDYEKQLQVADAAKQHLLEELTEFYEAKLQEKSALLEQVQNFMKENISKFYSSCSSSFFIVGLPLKVPISFSNPFQKRQNADLSVAMQNVDQNDPYRW